MADQIGAEGVNIRRATLSDARQVAELTVQLGYPSDETTMHARLARLLTNHAHQILVAEDDGKVAGWIHANISEAVESGQRAEICGLIVDKNARRRGIARQLVQAIEAWAREYGASAIGVRSNLQRAESHQLYPAIGYEKTKIQAVYRKRL